MTLHACKGLEFNVVFLAGMEEGILPHSQSRQEGEDIEEERRLCYVGMTRARKQLYCIHCYQRRMYGQFREQTPSPFLREIPQEVTEEVRLYKPPAYSSYGNSRGGSNPSWRERPLSGSSGGSGNYRPAGTPNRQPSMSKPTQRPASPGPTQSAKNLASFFKDAPVQFDPAALRPASSLPQGGSAPPPAGGSRELKRGSRVRHEQFGTGVILTMEGSGDAAKLTVYFDRAGTKKFIAKFAKLEVL